MLPHPDECELFYVERDTLFSGHKVTEIALQRMMSLYVASHYKNTPNDLLLLSDAPAHHLFVLTAPVPDKSKVRGSVFVIFTLLVVSALWVRSPRREGFMRGAPLSWDWPVLPAIS